jgi:hypothetical protein
MAEDTSFLYDVAFSFLSRDEHIAIQLNETVKVRFSVVSVKWWKSLSASSSSL